MTSGVYNKQKLCWTVKRYKLIFFSILHKGGLAFNQLSKKISCLTLLLGSSLYAAADSNPLDLLVNRIQAGSDNPPVSSISMEPVTLSLQAGDDNPSVSSISMEPVTLSSGSRPSPPSPRVQGCPTLVIAQENDKAFGRRGNMGYDPIVCDWITSRR